MKNLIKIFMCASVCVCVGESGRVGAGNPAMTTVAHPNCPQTVQICLVWFCCCTGETKRNETQMERKTQHGRRSVATQCNDERKIDMHVISRIRTSTRLADVDDVVSCTHTQHPTRTPQRIEPSPHTYINYAVYVPTFALFTSRSG